VVCSKQGEITSPSQSGSIVISEEIPCHRVDDIFSLKQ